jgi:PAS domain S-box-containing protein
MDESNIERLKARILELEKQTEERQKGSEYRYRLIFENSRDAIAITTRSGRILDVNQAASELFGEQKGELLGRRFQEFYRFPEDGSRFAKLMEQEGAIKDFTTILRRRDGVEMVCLFNVSTWRNDDGTVLGYQGIIRDVTLQKRAETALMHSEERYRSLVEESFDGIFIQKGFKIVFANRRLHEMLHYDDGELLGKEHWCVYHPEYWALTRKRAEARMAGESVPSRYEVVLQCKDGSSFPGEINARAMQIEGEQGVQVWVRDITEQRLAEAALRESEERAQAVIEWNPDPVVLCDMRGRVVHVNRAFSEVSGWPQEAAKDKPMTAFGPEKGWPEMESLLQEALSGEVLSGIETQLQSGSGELIPVSLSGASYRDRKGNLLGCVVCLRDIRERRRMEAQLRYSQKMEAIGTLAGGIAHDFNNLLMAIQGNVSLLLLETHASHHERLRNIENQVKSGARLTSQLLGYARKGRYELKPVDLNQLLRDVAETFGRTKKEITIHYDLASDLCGIEADHGQVEQVILNLLINAWQAMPMGGDLFIKTRNVTNENIANRLYTPKKGRYVFLEVKDTGVGIEDSIKKRIFEPFFTTKEMGRGTGLGLASVYGIVKGHGGYIDVESEKGKGASFMIHLPATGVVPDIRKEAARPFVKGRGTILLVDDEAMVLEVGAKLLSHMGYEVMKAGGGREAVEIFRKRFREIDLVILDMVMPGKGGGEVFDEMRAIHPDVKVLLLSGYSLDGEAKRIMDRGCNGFIQKPFGIHELSMKIGSLVEVKVAA